MLAPKEMARRAAGAAPSWELPFVAVHAGAPDGGAQHGHPELWAIVDWTRVAIVDRARVAIVDWARVGTQHAQPDSCPNWWPESAADDVRANANAAGAVRDARCLDRLQ